MGKERNEEGRRREEMKSFYKKASMASKLLKKKITWFLLGTLAILSFSGVVTYKSYVKIANVPPLGFCISKKDMKCLYFSKEKYKERVEEMKNITKYFHDIPTSFILLFPSEHKGKVALYHGFQEKMTNIIGVTLDEEAAKTTMHEILHSAFERKLDKEDRDAFILLIKKSLYIIGRIKDSEKIYNSIFLDFNIKSYEEQLKAVMKIIKSTDIDISKAVLNLALLNAYMKSFVNNIETIDEKKASEIFASIGSEALNNGVPPIFSEFYKKAGLKVDYFKPIYASFSDLEKMEKIIKK